jgi:hypothetical protein
VFDLNLEEIGAFDGYSFVDKLSFLSFDGFLFILAVNYDKYLFPNSTFEECGKAVFYGFYLLINFYN